jgi:hypothetical protein
MQTILDLEQKTTFEEFKNKCIYFFQSKGMDGTASKLGKDFIFEPSTDKTNGKRKDFFDGLMLNYFGNPKDNFFEVSEYQAGKNKNELHVYKITTSIDEALNELLKGNKRQPIKIWK